jgi:ribose transport system ATP-binding protein/rhamnose transport system ATP-binding protein
MAETPLLRVSGISKRFGATAALSGAGLNLSGSEVHALVGANGAGKSTLARIISGNIQPDTGTIEIDGRPVRHASARDAIRDGISIVTQETSLAPDLSVFENIMLPRMALPGRLKWGVMRRQAAELVERFGQEGNLDLQLPVRSLSIGQRQMVEMLRALALNGRIIIFDEPTAALSPRESERLFNIMRNLTAAGHGLIFVTHRLEEVFTVSNRVTVLREGRVMADAVPTGELTQGEIIRLMVGRELSDIYARKTSAPRDSKADSGRETVLSVRHLCAPPRVRDISFDVRKGEIVGLAGLVGAGRSEAIETIFGLRSAESGEVQCEGRPFTPNSPRAAIRAGIGFVPEDRRGQGVIPDFSVKENLLAAHLGARRGALLGYGEHQTEIDRLLGVLGLPAERMLDSNLLNFSGGMQQKIILARWLVLSPRLLLLDEPTRGVDIGTRSSIYALLRKIAGEGVACLVVSSDFEEVIGLTDRVVVISDGRSVADIPSDMVDAEKLAMFAAPRSSADRTHRVLDMLAERYGGMAFWARVEGEHVFCFDRVGNDPAANPGFAAGDIPEIADTRISAALRNRAAGFVAESDGQRFTLLVPIVGRIGHDFGFVGLCLAKLPDQVDVIELQGEIVSGMMDPAEGAAA